jgi:uncharacterized RDD family membrane protein YckC
LLGSSVRIHETQYPRLFRIVKDACAALDIPMPLVFVREEGSTVPVAALGFGEPYALVLSSHFVEVFADDELRFAIGCELGHIAAGHTRFLSLLSVNGTENPLISLIFGAWLRRCTTSCDKIGLLCCGSLDAAIRAMGVATFLEFGRKVDYEAFAEQHAEIEADNISRWGQWLGSDPYATSRIAALRRFITSPQYVAAADWFNRERGEEPPVLVPIGTSTVAEKDCAGWWRRFAAYAIDVVVVAAIIGSFGNPIQFNVSTSPSPSRPAASAHTPAPFRSHPHTSVTPTASSDSDSDSDSDSTSTSDSDSVPDSDSDSDSSATLGPFRFDEGGIHFHGITFEPASFNPSSKTGFSFWFYAYMAVLVAIVGQTFGMMITGLRVVSYDFQRPRWYQIALRYFIALCLWWLIAIFSIFWRRVLLHDKWSKTRLVKIERVVARATGTG